MVINRWISLDTSYTKLHLDSVGGLQFFTDTSTPQTGYDSIFISNIHADNAGLRFAIGRRADLFAGYTITKDTGDGRSTAAPTGATGASALLDSVQTFPLTYESPMARVSLRITPRLRWNAGWQYYGYNEQFELFSYYENYHAHTGFTSLQWAFSGTGTSSARLGRAPLALDELRSPGQAEAYPTNPAGSSWT